MGYAFYMRNINEIYEYHKNRTILDFKFIESVFDREERKYLKELQNKFPNHIIQMPNSDLKARGFISGIGGSVPADWNGMVYQAY